METGLPPEHLAVELNHPTSAPPRESGDPGLSSLAIPGTGLGSPLFAGRSGVLVMAPNGTSNPRGQI